MQHTTVMSGLVATGTTLLFQKKQPKRRKSPEKLESRGKTDNATTDDCNFSYHLRSKERQSQARTPRWLCPFDEHLLLLALTAIGFNGHNDIKDELFRQAINPLRLESTPILMLIGEKACGGANRLCHAV
jgi:hypothetical protein